MNARFRVLVMGCLFALCSTARAEGEAAGLPLAQVETQPVKMEQPAKAESNPVAQSEVNLPKRVNPRTRRARMVDVLRYTPDLKMLPVANPGFEGGALDEVQGWLLTQHTGEPAYEMELVEEAPHSGKRSFRMKRIHPEVYGLVSQSIRVQGFDGVTLELSASMRTQGVGPEGWALSLVFEGSPPGIFDTGILGHARSEALVGDTTWQQVVLKTTVPPNTRLITLGASLSDAGTGWVDDVRLRIVEP